MNDEARHFYNELAADYHLIYADWGKSVKRQGAILRQLITTKGYAPPARLLDASCGIGTQAIGLALQGYEVTGTDLSPKAIARAKVEARNFGLAIEFQTADMRTLSGTVDPSFDIIISCDNSLPHLLTDEDLALALNNIHHCLKPGGLFLASIRDYDALLRDRPVVTPTRVYGQGENRYFSFQEWIWDDIEPIYTLKHFMVKQKGGSWTTDCRTTKYRALQRSELTAFLKTTGFSDICWHRPEETGYFQPVVAAKKR